MDIDRPGEDWIYGPPEHKTAGHEIDKAIPTVCDARDALTPYLSGYGRLSDTPCGERLPGYARWLRQAHFRVASFANSGF
ncbi:hypothetical protein [Rhodopirellula europaea]|uniref:hypothetical protein n=1 Tax=Rhodopirellula europaea TaxID=1263866 RepID=UPI0030EB2FB0|tara:strand:- start:410 stop:649 length:240 start_codon:yes stop_codon:yes gene_type:complete